MTDHQADQLIGAILAIIASMNKGSYVGILFWFVSALWFFSLVDSNSYF